MNRMLDTQIVKGVTASSQSPGQVSHEFRQRFERGAKLRPAGTADPDPQDVLAAGYTPKHKLRLFGTTYYLTNRRYDDHLGFFVAYVVRDDAGANAPVYPRIFYKDISLLWRCATHYARSDFENWIGKGDLKRIVEDGVEMLASAEETTNLPLEIQPALDQLSRRVRRISRDDHAVELFLRRSPDHRLEPYRDFTEPRRKALSRENGTINNGEPIAYFREKNNPRSLRFVPGFEPDLRRGVLEMSGVSSNLYHGRVRKYRILSTNREIQYQFAAAPRHVWINPPQALTTEITTYGVRSVDVHADENLFVPGYEYHYLDDRTDPPELHSQIPQGFAGEPSDLDPSRADASGWIEQLPIIRKFRRLLAGSRR